MRASWFDLLGYNVANTSLFSGHVKGQNVGLVLVTTLAALPILAILTSLFTPPLSAWGRLTDSLLWTYIINTGGLMIMVGLLTGFIGTLTAWCITAFEFPGRKILSWMLILPLSAPAYIIAYFYTDLTEAYGPLHAGLQSLFSNSQYNLPNIRTIPGAAIMLSLVLYPYVYLLARAAFLSQSHGQWQAARSLGLHPRAAFYRVALPAARPAIAGGLALVLMETLADFGVADFFAIPTFSTGIFRVWLSQGDKPTAMKLAAIMLLIVFMLVMLESISRRGRVMTSGKTIQQMPRMKLSALKRYLLTIGCSLPVFFGFIIPVCGLSVYALSHGDNQGQSAFIQYAKNSFSVAALVALIATVIAIGLAYAKRKHTGRLIKTSVRLSTLGYALPGAMLAIGLLYPLGIMDQSLTRLARNIFGWQGGLLITGTAIALVYALSVRFLTVSFNSLSSGFEKIPLSIDHAARSLRATPLTLIRRIHFPLLRSSLIAGAILVFIDVMRELPATLILRPFNFDTLATRVYWLANDERLTEASTAALLIIIIGTVPVLLLNFFMTKSEQSS